MRHEAQSGIRVAKSKLALVAAVLLVPIALFYLFLESMCGNELLSEVYSPGKQFKAVVFSRDCGATTGFSTHVSIFHWWSWLGNSAGNTLIIDADPKVPLSHLENAPEVKVRWLSSDTVVISHHSLVRIFLSEHSAGNVKVEYEPFSK